jgi:hypothetical protein
MKLEFDEEGYKKAVDFQFSLLVDFNNKYNKIINDSTLSSTDKINERIELFNKKVKEIQESNFTEEQKMALIANLEYEQNDEKALKILIEDKKVPVSLVVSLQSAGVSFSDFLENIRLDFEDLNILEVGPGAMRGVQEYNDKAKALFEDSKPEYDRLLENFFSADEANIGESFTSIENFLQGLTTIGTGIFTDETISKAMTQLFNSVAVSAEKAAEKIKDFNQSGKGLSELGKKMSEGDFTSFAELSTEFGVENVKAFMAGTKTINELLQDGLDIREKELVKQIDILRAEIDRRKLNGENTDTLENQLGIYEYMYNNLELLSGYETARTYQLEKQKQTISDISGLISLQAELMKRSE